MFLLMTATLLVLFALHVLVGLDRAYLWLRCELTIPSHNPIRHPMGGYRCERCGMVGLYYSEFGLFERTSDNHDDYMPQRWHGRSAVERK